MRHIKKIFAVVLLCALILTSCAVVRPAMFKGKSASEWENKFRSTYVSLEKTGTPSEELNGFVVRVEGEDRKSDTIGGEVIEDSDYSGGKALRANYARDDSTTHGVNLSVTVPETGSYSLVTVVTRYGRMNTTDFDIYANDTYAYSVNTKDDVISEETVTGKANMRKMTLPSIMLNKGENTVSFVLQNTDRQPNKPNFYLDYIELKPDLSPSASGNIGYASTPTGDYSKQAVAAAELDVYTGSWDMRATFNLVSFASTEEEAADITVKITDYYGDVVLEHTERPVFGAYTLKIDLGKHPTGYFTVSAVTGTQTLFTKSYVVLPPVEDRDLESDSPFASDFASYHILADREDVVANYAAAAKLCGVSVLRERLDWIYTEWNEGGCDFSRADRFYNKINDMGLEILPFFSNAPRWTTENGKVFMDEQLAVYRFSKRVAERYANISQALEVWNEMDYFTYVPADMYASFYKAAALGVVDSGTSLPKIIGGLCEPVNSNPYLTILYKSDVFDYSDAFNWHYHIYDRAERSVTEFVDGTKAGQFATFANTYLSSLPSWCTEAGIKLYTPAGCADMTFAQQKIQANYMVTSACQSLAAGTDKHFWFILGNMPEDGGWFGSYGADDRPFASVVTEAVMTQTLGKGIYKGELKGLPSGAEGHVINNGEDDVIVLWATSDRDVTLSVPGNVLKTTVVGNREVLCSTNGKITVKAGSEPMFITVDGTVDASSYTATSNDEIKTISAKSDFTVGERVILTQFWYNLTDSASYLSARNNGYRVSANGNTITLQLVNFNDFEVTGTVSGSADGYTVTGSVETITIPAMSETEVTFTITPNGGTGATYLTFEGTFNGSETSKSVSRIYG
jgi:lipoprotein